MCWRLPTPRRWDKQTPASLAMGYALNVTPLTVTRIEAHLDSTGCVGQNGIVNLRTDTALNISGDFDVTGMVSSADPTPCHLFGTLAGIPVDR